MKCPRDGEALIRRQNKYGSFHACERCQGLWLLERDLAGAIQAKAAEHRPPPVEPPPNNRPPANCPMDRGETLDMKTYLGVQIDVCPNHRGVWLDGGELETLACRYRPGQESQWDGDDDVCADFIDLVPYAPEEMRLDLSPLPRDGVDVRPDRVVDRAVDSAARGAGSMLPSLKTPINQPKSGWFASLFDFFDGR